MSKQLLSLGLAVCLTGVMGIAVHAQSSENLSLMSSDQANKLGLTMEQKKALVQVQKQTHANIEGILTPGQLQQFQASLAQGATTRDALKSVNLELRQKIRIKNVMEGMMGQLKTILTPAQFEQIKDSMA